MVGAIKHDTTLMFLQELALHSSPDKPFTAVENTFLKPAICFLFI